MTKVNPVKGIIKHILDNLHKADILIQVGDYTTNIETIRGYTIILDRIELDTRKGTITIKLNKNELTDIDTEVDSFLEL